MTISRSVLGALVGIIAVIIWQTLGADALLVALVVGAVGFLIGWVLDHPDRLIEFLQRLER